MNPPKDNATEKLPAKKIFQEMGDTFPGKSPKLELNFTPTAEDLGELLFRFYIPRGLDAINIGPIGESWLENIWNHVPQKLQLAYEDLFNELLDEVTGEYSVTVKFHISDTEFTEFTEILNFQNLD